MSKIDLKDFKIVDTHMLKPQIKVMEKIITLNSDIKKWLNGEYLTVRINYESKQIAFVKEGNEETPKQAIKPVSNASGGQLRINSLGLAKTIRELVEIGSKEVLTLRGEFIDDYILFKVD